MPRLFSLLLLSRLPHVSAAISAAIVIHRPCHLENLITLSSSTCIPLSVLIRRRLHHPVSLPPLSLLLYVYAASLLLLFPPSCVSADVALPYCAPAPSRPPVTTERRNLVSWAPHSGRLGVCVLIGGMPLPFRLGDSPLSYRAVDVASSVITCPFLWSGIPYPT